jgi:hypothetical protein
VPDEPKDQTKKEEPTPPPTGTGGASIEAAKTEESAKAEASDDAPKEGVDAFRPEEIAKRIDRVGGETEIERLAREEEEKLAARRREKKKAGKKKGLEAAASKKLAKIGDKPKRAVATALPLAPDVDPLIDRTAKLSKWARQNQRFVSGLLTLVFLALVAGGVYLYIQKKHEGDASLVLASAIADERGRVGDPEKDKPQAGQLQDLRPIFKTDAERRDAALAKYREVQQKYSGTGAAIFGRLGEAAILLDKRDASGALAAYNDVKASALGQVDAEVKARSLEGIGFADELLAADKPDQKDHYLDEAMKSYKALADVDARGMKELGQYHQARIHEERGEKDDAITLLKAVHEATTKVGTEHPFYYLETVADDRLRGLDRNAIPSKSVQRMIEQMQKQTGAKMPAAP